MNNTTTSSNASAGPSTATIIKAGLLAGTLDICSAFLYGYIKRGTTPEIILRSISKVAFGKTTFTDTTVLAIAGLLAHFAIAMCWSILFFILYRRLNFMRQNIILTAMLYGLFIWVMMSIVILPLWNNKPFVFNAEGASISALILMVAIGLPLSLIAHNHYSGKAKT